MKFRLIIKRTDATGVLGQYVELEEFNQESFILNCLQKAGELTRTVAGWTADKTLLEIDFETMDPESLEMLIDKYFVVREKYVVDLNKAREVELPYIDEVLESLAIVKIEGNRVKVGRMVSEDLNRLLFDPKPQQDLWAIAKLVRVKVCKRTGDGHTMYSLSSRQLKETEMVNKIMQEE